MDKKNMLSLCKRFTFVLVVIGFTLFLTACKKANDEFTLNVLSYNMKFESKTGGGDPIYTWARRKPGIVQSFKDYKADIVGTQELEKWQLDELMEALGDKYTAVGEPRYLPNSEHSAIIYRSDKFEYIEGDTIWLSETPDVRGSKSWDSAHPRILTYGKFRDKAHDVEFYFFNTHLDHRSQLARKEGLKIIVDRMLMVKDYPIILTGDFNMYLDSEEMEAINNQKELFSDTFTPFAPEFDVDGLTSHGFQGGTVGKPIDFIFYSKNTLDVVKTKIIRDKWEDRFYLSDHYPVYSQFKLVKE